MPYPLKRQCPYMTCWGEDYERESPCANWVPTESKSGYCTQHQKRLDEIDELDRIVATLLRNRTKPS